MSVRFATIGSLPKRSLRREVSQFGVQVVIAEAATARKSKTRYTIGCDSAVLTRVARFLPDRGLD